MLPAAPIRRNLAAFFGGVESLALTTHGPRVGPCDCEFINAEQAEPVLAAEALDQIGALYAVEAEIQQAASPRAPVYPPLKVSARLRGKKGSMKPTFSFLGCRITRV